MYCSCIFNRIAIDQLSRDSPPRMSTAALSAAVDSRKPIRSLAPIQAEPTPQKHTPQTPSALRERGVWGERGFSQRSRLSPRVPHVFLLCTSAAALSAAVDSINKQKTAPTLRRNRLRRSTQLKRHPLFGREREGGASLREAASLAYPHFRSALRERSGLSPRAPHVPPSFAGIFLRVSNETSYRFG